MASAEFCDAFKAFVDGFSALADAVRVNAAIERKQNKTNMDAIPAMKTRRPRRDLMELSVMLDLRNRHWGIQRCSIACITRSWLTDCCCNSDCDDSWTRRRLMCASSAGSGRVHKLLDCLFLLVDFGQVLCAELLVNPDLFLRLLLLADSGVVRSQAKMPVG